MAAGAGPLAVFGGTFNPPHVAHLAVAAAAAEAVRAERVLWVPAALNPHKLAADAPAPEHRLEMVRLAIAGDPMFEVSAIEIERGGASYTVDTLRALRAEEPDRELALIVGGDSLAGFDSWRDPEAILDLARLVVYRRPGFDETGVPPGVLENATFVDAPALELSGTALRRRIAAGRTVRYLVPDAVVEYIGREGLYGTGWS